MGSLLALWRRAPAFRWLLGATLAATGLALLFPPRLSRPAALGSAHYTPPVAPPPIPTGPGGSPVAVPDPSPMPGRPTAPIAATRPGLPADAGGTAAVAPSWSLRPEGLAPARPGLAP